MATKLNTPRLVRPRGQDSAAADQPAVTFDVDAFHAMQKRDDGLIAERVLDGSKGKVFIYKFVIKGTEVRGISVDGAHHLANYYGGIQHRIVASMEKKGAVFTFTSYPAPEMPMTVSVAVVRELEDEPDFYRAVVECKDIKTGNAFQAEKLEERFEKRRDGSLWERPNYATIAQSKARRNAILMLVPRDVQEKFEEKCIQAGDTRDLTEDVFADKRRLVATFAAKNGISLDRERLNELSNDQIAGLREAMKEGGVEAFQKALGGLGLAYSEAVAQEGEEEEPRQQPQNGDIAKPAEPTPAADKPLQAPRGRPGDDDPSDDPSAMFR